MKFPMPNIELAKLAVEAYQGDGVRAELGYDDLTAQWYADLNDEDYEQYMKLLRANQGAVLDQFAKPWSGATNIQSLATEPPPAGAETLFLYLVDNSCGTAKGFKVTSGVKTLLGRQASFLQFCSTCDSCGKQMSGLLIWQKQKIKG